ncbi:MAG: hypothetical protein GY913_09025 [Proteobacteria bacterium]|nr:hypothetical protein [Pseudomonadota bacterium]MCP4917053.1 hypothetical protein [Pseudomonadota bacterium]
MSSRLKPSRRLNVLLVPEDPDRMAPDGLMDALGELGLHTRGGPGPRADELLPGGFKLLRVDHPGRAYLYGNRQGGFHALCPQTGANIVPLLGRAITAWQHGGARTLDCSCGDQHDLNGLDYRPPAAIGRFAIEARDVAGLSLGPARAEIEALVGPVVVVGSRG